MNQETKALLRDCGRDIAVGQMESAIKTSPSQEVMHNQIRVLHYASVHVLATQLFNAEFQGRASPELAEQLLIAEIRAELQFLRGQPKEELIYAEPGGGE